MRAGNACGDVSFCVVSKEGQQFNFAQRVRLYPSGPIAVSPGIRIELEMRAIDLATRQRDYYEAVGVTSKRVGSLASRFRAVRLLIASHAWIIQRSIAIKLAHSPHFSIRSIEQRLGVLATQISPSKRAAMIPLDRPGSINLREVVDNEGGHGQALRRPHRSPPVTAVAKTRGSLPSGAANIGHIGPPLDRARERRDLRSLSAHAAPCRK